MEKGWAWFLGAEGKIKGGGVTPTLTLCLNIVFRGSTTKGFGVTVIAFYAVLLANIGGVTF